MFIAVIFTLTYAAMCCFKYFYVLFSEPKNKRQSIIAVFISDANDMIIILMFKVINFSDIMPNEIMEI